MSLIQQVIYIYRLDCILLVDYIPNVQSVYKDEERRSDRFDGPSLAITSRFHWTLPCLPGEALRAWGTWDVATRLPLVVTKCCKSVIHSDSLPPFIFNTPKPCFRGRRHIPGSSTSAENPARMLSDWNFNPNPVSLKFLPEWILAILVLFRRIECLEWIDNQSLDCHRDEQHIFRLGGSQMGNNDVPGYVELVFRFFFRPNDACFRPNDANFRPKQNQQNWKNTCYKPSTKFSAASTDY